MECPHCQTALEEKEYEGVPIEACPSCRGVWLKEVHLNAIVRIRQEQFTPEQRREAMEQIQMDVSADQLYRCPACTEILVKINYAGDMGVIVDCCPRHHGLWLDQGELEKAQILWESRAQHFTDFIVLFAIALDEP